MLSVEAPGEAVAEIERQAAINEDIIRWLTIRVAELEKGPSVMMRKQERRGGRGRDSANYGAQDNGTTLFPPPQDLPLPREGPHGHLFQGRPPPPASPAEPRHDLPAA